MTPPGRSVENGSKADHDHSGVQLGDPSNTRAANHRWTDSCVPSRYSDRDRVHDRASDSDAECRDPPSPGSDRRSPLSAFEWSDFSSRTASLAWFEVFENALLSFMLSGIAWNIAAGYDLVAAGAVPVGLVLTTVILATLFSCDTFLRATTTTPLGFSMAPNTTNRSDSEDD